MSGYFGSTYKSGLSIIDFELISKSCGIKYQSVKSVGELTPDLLSSQTKPIIIDIFIDTRTIVVPYVKSILKKDGSFKSGTLRDLEPNI